MKKIYVLLSLLIFITACKGQNIVSSLKDKNGDLWFNVSGRGVYRYDGKSFVNFTKENYRLNIGLTSCLYEDKVGNLWFNTNKGLCFYDGKAFTEFKIPLPLIGLINPDRYSVLSRIPIEVSGILQDKNGKFWFLTLEHGAYCYNPRMKDSLGQEKSFSSFLLDDAPNCIIETKKGDIFIGSWNGHGVFRYESSTAGQAMFEKFGGFSDGMIACMLEDKNGNMWVGTRNASVDRYDSRFIDRVGQRKAVTNFTAKDGLTDNSIYCVYEDSKGNIWMGADTGNSSIRGDAFYYDGKSFNNITSKLGLTLVEDFVYGVKSIIEDKVGNIWIGSKKGLLLCYDGRKFIDFSEKIEK